MPIDSTEVLADQIRIGQFIADLRLARGITQQGLAKALGTSQSAVARMERGQQNFTTEMLTKISRALGRDVVTVGTGAINFRIEGGHKLSGTVEINTSKNSAVALLCAALLNQDKTIIKNIARIEEVKRLIEVLESIGVRVRWTGQNDLEITPPAKLNLAKLNVASAVKTRSMLMMLGPLAHLFKRFELPHPGGCNLGERHVRAHLYALEKLGVQIKTTHDSYQVTHGKMQPAEIIMYEASDTATATALMAAAKLPGTTVIKFASANYGVQDLCLYLQALGVRIEGIGTTTMTVHGKARLSKRVKVYPSEDPIEAMLFLSAAATTGSGITIERCPIDFLALELLKLEKMGFQYKILRRYQAANGFTELADIQTFPSKLTAPADKIHAQPYPGINQDNLPFFVPIATQAHGTTLIHDWTYENRAIYFMELQKLGADITLADPHRVYVKGPTRLKGAEIICPPALRPAAIILIAMLAAEGTSLLRNVYTINRGYEDIVERLRGLGAEISTVTSL
jgi:UDP-N-acetylglucosamine 1-carboxyvinyltransferase